MIIEKSKTASIVLLSFLVISCHVKKDSVVNGSNLKKAYEKDFYIGTALDINQINENDSEVNNLIVTQFNAITPENIMKCEVIHPQWDTYEFDLTDKFVAYGKKNKMFLVGHTLGTANWHHL